MPVRIEKDGHVTTVIMNRPEVRNAVDHATALELQTAFRAFEADPDAYVGQWHEVKGGSGAPAERAVSRGNDEKKTNRSLPG